MFADDMVADGPVADFRPVRPARTRGKLADQLRHLHRELPPDLQARWGDVVEAAAKALYRPGAPPKGSVAGQYIREQRAQGRPINTKLIGEAADRARCTAETVRDWLKREGIIN